ncbi:MAG: tetratricopeptide repeat protein [Aquificaceae bacterium]|nr:tetratricopeptide repeat protein [Aquificaceae bacterium]MDW8422907.1 tetratricopeptide repeat protein [Aquificaceae bacterium]
MFIFFIPLSCAVKEENVGKSQWQYNYDLGMSSYLAKNYSEAISHFFKASQIAPNEPKVWNALGLVYMEVKEYQKSENAFLRALQVNKDYTEAKLNLGLLYYRQGEYDRAIRVLREVLEDEAFPQKHMAFYYLGKVYQALGNSKEYVQNLQKATNYNPMFVEAQMELAQAYESEGDFQSAKIVYQTLINNNISSPTVDLNMARVEYRLGNYASAKGYIKRVLEDRQTTSQLKAQAYELLSEVLIAEQRLLSAPKSETTTPKSVQTIAPQERTYKEDYSKSNTQPPLKFYRIQLGAFSSVGSAKAWKEKLERELNLKDIVVIESPGVFKVYYGAFTSREDAIKELERLKNLNLYGFIVYE